MESESMELQYREYLNTLPLTSLRVLGRMQGVPPALSGKKPDLVNGITDILIGKEQPVPRSGRGAPPRTVYLDPKIPEKLEEIRRQGEKMRAKTTFEIRSPIAEQIKNETSVVYKGILEIMQSGYGFLRAKNCQPTNGDDVFIAAPLIHSYRLREGDYVTCYVKPRLKNDSAAIGEVITVNGMTVGNYEQRPFFDALTATYSEEKIAFSEKDDTLSLRILDLFVPIGKGQRGLIIAPPKAGKTTLLKEIARSVSRNHPEISLIVLLIDERPEEVTDFRTSIPEAEVIYSTFDEGADHHIRAAKLTVAHAKRMAEQGKDVVILLDSLTKLTRAYNYLAESSGKTLSGGLDAGAFAEPKRFFGAARNTEEAGSITILATALVDTGSRMDDVIYEEFKGTGNSDIFLSRELASSPRSTSAVRGRDGRRSSSRRANFPPSTSSASAGSWRMRKGSMR